jgi:hypothetical protein
MLVSSSLEVQYIDEIELDNSKSIQLTITDECAACGTDGLDLPYWVFEEFSSLSQGILAVTWNYL